MSFSGELGSTRGVHYITTPGEYRQALFELANQSKRHIKIFTQTLDSNLYNEIDWISVVSDTITEHKRLQIKVLIVNPAPAAESGLRLVEMCQRLSSFVAIHRAPQEARGSREEFVTFDEVGMLKRYPHSDFKGHVEFRTTDARTKSDYFTSLWEKSEPCRELMRVYV